MTSQIAIYNPLGVAVASDTVTTIPSDRGIKTTSNAHKLWTIGDNHLIVVAHSGAVQINGIHSELLVSEWARTLSSALPTVVDYANSFASWLASSPDWIPVESEVREIHRHLNDHYYEIRRRLEVDEPSVSNEGEFVEMFKHHVNAGLEWLEQLESYDGVTDESDADLIIRLEVDLDEKINYIFKEVPGLEEVRDILKKSAPLVLSRAQESSNDSDLSFIGFGRDDYFATSVKVSSRGRYGSGVRAIMGEAFGASADSQSGSISTFAQSNAMQGFLRGAQYDTLDRVYDYLWDHFVGEDDSDATKKQEASELIAGLRKQIEKFQWESFISPMLDTIGTLSLTEMGNLASSLVGMQAIRSAASPEPASVGGFIESLVINRAEGIRWINRLPR